MSLSFRKLGSLVRAPGHPPSWGQTWGSAGAPMPDGMQHSVRKVPKPQQCPRVSPSCRLASAWDSGGVSQADSASRVLPEGRPGQAAGLLTPEAWAALWAVTRFRKNARGRAVFDRQGFPEQNFLALGPATTHSRHMLVWRNAFNGGYKYGGSGLTACRGDREPFAAV